MLEKHLLQIVQELSLQPRQVAATAVLLEEGATVPFIARYRKERTGELDEVQITNIRDRMQELEELDKRRESILSSLEERKLLTEELKVKIDAAKNLSTLEDLYLPFRPKKRTRLRARRSACQWMRAITPKVMAGWRHRARRIEAAVTGSSSPLTLVCSSGPWASS